MVRAATIVALLLLACGGGLPPPSETPPAAPAANDPAYAVDQVRSWYIVGNEVTPGHDELVVRVFPPEGTEYVDMWIGGQPGIRLVDYDTDLRQKFDVSTLPPGEYELLLAADGADTAFYRHVFYRSHPLYAIVTNDWDDADNTAVAERLQERLHEQHPSLKMTHFVGPYTFTDPTVSDARRQELVDWVLGMRDTYGDEIGLHIHPYCNFVDTVEGVDCLHEPSTVYANGDPTGYTVMCAAYTEEEFTTLLEASDALFEQWGLGKPTSFRAGGWTADLSTMRALANAGYIADTSANNWARMEEWEGVQNGVLYEWNKTNWATIDDTSQPYYPSESDILSDAAPTIPVLQIPDNGILVDYVTADEMIEIFEKNWPGGALEQPTAYSIGYHPSNFNDLYFRRLNQVFFHIEQFLIDDDRGPVTYGLMSDMPKVWKRAE
jgi:hypothetical protein